MNSVYKNFQDKSSYFKISRTLPDNRIDTKEQFDNWYEKWKIKCIKRPLHTTFFRGLDNASYKLFTTAQRTWIFNHNESNERKLKYRTFFKELMRNTQEHPVLSRVFKLYRLDHNQLSIPALSLIQHYGGSTPLMDWTHSMDIALYFASKKVTTFDNTYDINNYISIYRINNTKTGIKSLRDISADEYPSINSLMEELRKGDLAPHRLFYFSEFESLESFKPFTTIYNQNIIPQEGLFIFNPSRTNPLEDYFPKDRDEKGQIRCYNIHKSLAGYICEKLNSIKITEEFIFPNLDHIIGNINNETVAKFFNP